MKDTTFIIITMVLLFGMASLTQIFPEEEFFKWAMILPIGMFLFMFGKWIIQIFGKKD